MFIREIRAKGFQLIFFPTPFFKEGNKILMNLAFRPFTMEDAEEVSAMMLDLYVGDPGGAPMNLTKTQETFAALLEKPDRGNIIVMLRDGVLVGYSVLINFWSNEYGGNLLHIDELYVKAAYRGQGIASQFIRYLREQQFNNLVGMMLEVSDINDQARKLYLSLGFKRHKNEVLFMKK